MLLRLPGLPSLPELRATHFCVYAGPRDTPKLWTSLPHLISRTRREGQRSAGPAAAQPHSARGRCLRPRRRRSGPGGADRAAPGAVQWDSRFGGHREGGSSCSHPKPPGHRSSRAPTKRWARRVPTRGRAQGSSPALRPSAPPRRPLSLASSLPLCLPSCPLPQAPHPAAPANSSCSLLLPPLLPSPVLSASPALPSSCAALPRCGLVFHHRPRRRGCHSAPRAAQSRSDNPARAGGGGAAGKLLRAGRPRSRCPLAAAWLGAIPRPRAPRAPLNGEARSPRGDAARAAGAGREGRSGPAGVRLRGALGAAAGAGGCAGESPMVGAGGAAASFPLSGSHRAVAAVSGGTCVLRGTRSRLAGELERLASSGFRGLDGKRR